MSRSSALAVSPRHSSITPRRSGSPRRAARIFGLGVLVVGLAIVTIVCVQLLRGMVARERARTEWAKVMKSSQISVIASIGQRRIASGRPVVRVIIPVIRLDEVVVEGMSDKDLWAGPGHLPGTVLPGQNGNSVISAHRDRHFHRLDDVRIGDIVETQTPEMSVMWRVTQRRVIGKDERVITESVEPLLTLTTCWPTRYIGPAPDRLILTAEPISMKERERGPVAAPVTPASVTPASPIDTAKRTGA